MNKQILALSMQFIGTKLVDAIPMTRQEYNDYRGWELPENEKNLADEKGFLIEYKDGGRANHENHKGYISWSPKDVFEQSYKSNGALRFGDALVMLKAGKRVARSGWNGKDMWLKLLHPTEYVLMTLPYIYMKTATNDLVPWLASQTDMLAEDWTVLDESNQLSEKNNFMGESKASVNTQEPQQVNCVENKLKCKSCGKTKDDSERIAHNHLMEKCNLLRHIIEISHNDRGTDHNRDLKDEAATKLKALIAEF